jgi:hypothetical protein
MSWADYQPPTAEVPLGGGAKGRVRGLNVDDLSSLVTNHLESISKAVALYAASKKDVYSTKNLHAFIIQTASQFPGLVSEVISLAADEPSLKGKKIALGVQIAALNEIARLTLEELGGLGNLSLVLVNLAKGALSEYPNLRAPATTTKRSPASIGDAEKT